MYARCQSRGQLVGNGEYVVPAFVQLCLVAVCSSERRTGSIGRRYRSCEPISLFDERS